MKTNESGLKRHSSQLAAAAAGLALMMFGAACSHTQMMSAPVPLWDSEKAWDANGIYKNNQGDPSERVNVWPIYYYHKPVTAVLWPIFTKADKSHELVPLYAWDGETRRLNLGAVTDWIPPLARFDRDKTDWRALNVWHDAGKKEWGAFPFWFYNGEEKNSRLFPLFYDDWSSGHHEYWTPLWTQQDDLQGFAGPLFNRSQGWDGDFWTYSAPWPFVRWWSSAQKSGFSTPLVSWNRDGLKREHAALYGLLYDGESGAQGAEAKLLLGLGGGYERNAEIGLHHWAPLLWTYTGKGEKTSLETLPYMHERDGDDKSTTTLGLIAYRETRSPDSVSRLVLGGLAGGYEKNPEIGVNHWAPLLWSSTKKGENSSFISLPYIHTREGSEEDTVLGLIGYMDFKTRGDRLRAWAFPFFTKYESAKGKFWAAFPLAAYEKHADGTRGFYSAPLSFKTDGSFRNVGIVLYNETNKNDEHYQSALWPLMTRRTTPNSSEWTVLPLAHSERSKDASTFISLPYAKHEDADGKWSSVLGPVYGQAENIKVGTKDKWAMWPLAASHEEANSSYDYAFPVAYHWKKGERESRLILPLGYSESSGGDKTIITPLYSQRRGGEKEWTNFVGPLYFKSEDHKTQATDLHAPWPLVRRHVEKDSSYWYAFPFVGGKKNGGGSAWYTPPLSRGKFDDGSFWNLGGLLAWHTRTAESVATRVLVLFGHKRNLKDDGVMTELWPLVHYRKTPEDVEFWSLTNSHYRNRNTEAEMRGEIDRQYQAMETSVAERERRTKYPDVNYGIGGQRIREDNYLFRLYHREVSIDGRVKSVDGPGNAVKTAPVKTTLAYEKKDEGWLFPLFYHYNSAAGEDRFSEFNLLWRLYDSHEGVDPESGETVAMKRVLWRVFHRERVGEKVSTDIFPFIAMDKDESEANGVKKDFSKFSFAGGLIEMQREGGNRRGKFFWIPFGSK